LENDDIVESLVRNFKDETIPHIQFNFCSNPLDARENMYKTK